MKNRKREICTSGSVRDEDGQPPHLLGRRQFLRLAASAAALPPIARVANAETYPARPIRLVVPFPPGGAFDALARPLVEQVKPLLGTMIVENIGGGGSSLGAAAVARARPDGYTILLGGTLPHVNEALLKSRPLYDPVKDLDPIAGLAVIALALAVHPSVPAQNLKEFVAYAKDSGPDQRTGCHGRNGCNRAIARISSVGKAADPRGDEPEASHRRAVSVAQKFVIVT
jgi:tripartite-type tricarboxylate transporter receptor subunit TctC